MLGISIDALTKRGSPTLAEPGDLAYASSKEPLHIVHEAISLLRDQLDRQYALVQQQEERQARLDAHLVELTSQNRNLTIVNASLLHSLGESCISMTKLSQKLADAVHQIRSDPKGCDGGHYSQE